MSKQEQQTQKSASENKQNKTKGRANKLSVNDANSLELNRWLKLWRLDDYEGKLRELGVKLPIDVLDIEDSHLNTLSMKPLELKRWVEALSELRADKSNKILSGIIPSPHTRTTPADQFEEPYMFGVLDAITSIVGPPAEASVSTFETGWEYTLESTFDAAAGVAVVVSETLALDDDDDEDALVNTESKNSGDY